MAALGSNMKGRAEKKETTPSKPKKKQVKKKVTKTPLAKVVAKEVKTSKSLVAKKAVKKTVLVEKKPSIKKPDLISKKVEAKKVKPQKVKTSTEKVIKASIPKIEKQPELKLRNAKLIVEPSKRKKIRKTKVIMEGDLNINNVDAFIQKVKPLFDDYDFIDFFIREATSLDLSHLQMLYYFQNHFVKKGKTVTVDANLSPDFKKIIISNGFKEFMFIPKLV